LPIEPDVSLFVLMVKAVCGESRTHGLEGGKIPQGIYLSLLVVATPVSRLLDTLPEHPGGAAIQEAIDRYLARYGHQIQTLDFCEPTAGEDPTLVLLNLKALVQSTDYNPASRQADLAVKREEALKRADEYFSGELHDEFQMLLSDAKRYYPLREEGLFYLGAGWPVLRRLALELGRRLAEVGTLASPDEVFYLTRAC
jgi:pyruvate,water dikinase